MKRINFPMWPGCSARSGASPAPLNATSREAVSRANGNVPSEPPMNSTAFPRVEVSNPRIELPADQMAPDEQLQEDLALVQLDTVFVALMSEISARQPQQGGGQARRDAESVRSDEASRTRKTESVLARLEPVEQAIMATPARTIVGLGIKARHAAYVVSEHWDAPIEQIDWDARAVRRNPTLRQARRHRIWFIAYHMDEATGGLPASCAVSAEEPLENPLAQLQAPWLASP